MTIIEALRLSKESNGRRAYMRPSASGGFCRWVDGFSYRLAGIDLLADDWEDMETGIQKWTGAKTGESPSGSGRNP